MRPHEVLFIASGLSTLLLVSMLLLGVVISWAQKLQNVLTPNHSCHIHLLSLASSQIYLPKYNDSGQCPCINVGSIITDRSQKRIWPAFTV